MLMVLKNDELTAFDKVATFDVVQALTGDEVASFDKVAAFYG